MFTPNFRLFWSFATTTKNVPTVANQAYAMYLYAHDCTLPLIIYIYKIFNYLKIQMFYFSGEVLVYKLSATHFMG